MLKNIKYELQHILSGKAEVKHGNIIQTITRHLARSEKSSEEAKITKHFKKEETEKLIDWIDSQAFWYDKIIFENFISEGAEQRVYLDNGNFVIKLNDSIYYETWLDYFNNLLLNNFFFPDTAYELLGFHLNNKILYAVVKQRFVKSNKITNLENVKEILGKQWFYK